MEEISYLGEDIRRWQIGASTFFALPEKGARLLSWQFLRPDDSVREVIYWPEIDSLASPGKIRGGNPILFPFAGRCYEDGEEGYWRDPSGTRRPMPRHGFAREGNFEILRMDKGGFSAQLVPTKEDLRAYPFRYEFAVGYRFAETSLFVEMRLKNCDTVAIPWSAGHHFYFGLPWRERMGRDHYWLQMPAKAAYTQASDGSLLPVHDLPRQENFGNPDLPDRIYTRLKSGLVTFGDIFGEERVELAIGTDRKPHKDHAVVVWTESDNSPFYCVEPWMGPPNSPEHRIGFHTVKPGKSADFLVEIRLA